MFAESHHYRYLSNTSHVMLSQTKFQNKDMAICRDMLRLILVTHDKSNNKKNTETTFVSPSKFTVDKK